MLIWWCPSADRDRHRDIVFFVNAGGGLDFGGGRMSAGQFLVEFDSQGRLRCFRTLELGIVTPVDEDDDRESTRRRLP